MSIESAADLEALREVGRITRETLDALEARVKAGATTAELDAVAAAVFAANGARSAPALVYGFPGAVLISINDEIVHGVPGDRRIEPGDLVKLDVTVEKNGYIRRCRPQRAWLERDRRSPSAWSLAPARPSRPPWPWPASARE